MRKYNKNNEKYNRYKEYNRKYAREYWKKRRETDKIWVEKKKKYDKEYQKNRADSRTRRRFLVLARDKFTCQYCGRKAPDVQLNVDHIFPKSRGGKDNINNLITACFECNSGKSDIIIEHNSGDN